MKVLIVLALLLTIHASADEVFRIQIGQENQRYSNADLQRRVWELERAVFQLQQRVFQLEGQPTKQADSWVCTIQTMGNNYVGTGPSKALASAKAIENCKTTRGGDGFFCKDPKCEQ